MTTADTNEQSITFLKSQCQKALRCLYIAVESSIADDINQKVKDYVLELERRCGLKFDRQGHERCAGYNEEDFVPCTLCRGSGRCGEKGDAICSKCGGYGEIPKEPKCP